MSSVRYSSDEDDDDEGADDDDVPPGEPSDPAAYAGYPASGNSGYPASMMAPATTHASSTVNNTYNQYVHQTYEAPDNIVRCGLSRVSATRVCMYR